MKKKKSLFLCVCGSVEQFYNMLLSVSICPRKAIQFLTMIFWNHSVLNPDFKMRNNANRLQLPNKVFGQKLTNDHALICYPGKGECTLPIKKVLFDYGRHLRYICKCYLVFIHSG